MTAIQKKKGEAAPALSDILAEIGKKAAELDKLDTSISQIIARVETGLREHFSTRITHAFPFDSDGRVLTFGKWEGKWQLLIEAGNADAPQSPLSSCTREVRCEVFTDGHVESLIRGAVAQLEAQLKQRHAAIATGTALAEALDGLPF